MQTQSHVWPPLWSISVCSAARSQGRSFILLEKSKSVCLLSSFWESESFSHSVVFSSLWPPWNVAHQVPLSTEFSRQKYWVGSHSLLQGIFLTQGSNSGLQHCRQILYHLSLQGSCRDSAGRKREEEEVSFGPEAIWKASIEGLVLLSLYWHKYILTYCWERIRVWSKSSTIIGTVQAGEKLYCKFWRGQLKPPVAMLVGPEIGQMTSTDRS